MSSSAATLSTLAKPLHILHTSDWHLGRRLYGRMRYDEFEAFLGWLEATITTQNIDVLIVAGDVFDTMTPSNRAQALYYEFLGKVAALCCQHIIIVAGNHDSPTFLDAPSHVLKFLNVHVIGTACENVEDEVLVLNDTHGEPHCIIAAVPYLRDRDVRSSRAGESADSKDANVIKGIRAHYDAVAAIAKTQQAALKRAHQRHIPIIATGHLFAAGGQTTDDDGVRDLYVGNLGQVSADMFDHGFDYVALGHLHVPQRVGGCEHIRYSGSPIAMGFGEARQQKQVLIVKFGERLQERTTAELSHLPSQATEPAAVSAIEKAAKPTMQQTTQQKHPLMDDLFGFDDVSAGVPNEPDNTDNALKQQPSTVSANHTPITDDDSDGNEAAALSPHLDSTLLHINEGNAMQVVSLAIPCFQKLAQVSGDLTTIAKTIRSFDPAQSIWLEVIYDGEDIVHELREDITIMIEGLACEVLKIKNTRTYNKVLNQEQTAEHLQDLNEMDVFDHCLDINGITNTQKASLRDAYQQILHSIYHHDSRAE